MHILNRVIREGLTEKAVFEQRPEGVEGIGQILGREKVICLERKACLEEQQGDQLGWSSYSSWESGATTGDQDSREPERWVCRTLSRQETTGGF